MEYHFCTLFDKNYLYKGLALYSSLERYCPNFSLWILCMDKTTYKILKKLQLKQVTLISLKEFEDKKLLSVKNSRTLGEYCWTCTSSLILYLFKRYKKLDIIAYLDADLFFSPLRSLSIKHLKIIQFYLFPIIILKNINIWSGFMENIMLVCCFLEKIKMD